MFRKKARLILIYKFVSNKIIIIKGSLIKWFENYLYQRKQKMINRATSSTVCEVSAGVPQGSVLGPLALLLSKIYQAFQSFDFLHT
jgi:hypothetical protein